MKTTVIIQKVNRYKYRYLAHWCIDQHIYYDYFRNRKEIKEYFSGWPNVEIKTAWTVGTP